MRQISLYGKEVDILVHHGLVYQRSAGRFPLYATINDVNPRTLVSAKIFAILEEDGIVRHDGKRRNGIVLIPWRKECPFVGHFFVDTEAPMQFSAMMVKADAAV